MLTWFDSLRGIDMASVALRMFLAVLCGGLIGLEREQKRRPAGFRTHILICLGACMTTLTGQYLYFYMGYNTDMARLGAQVVAGIGFIGAGTIIVTKQQRVRGLTTAAGLWTVAIVGLACGAGYYEGVLAATVLVLVAELFFSKVEYWLVSRAREVHLYVELERPENMDEVIRRMRETGVKVLNLEITHQSEGELRKSCAVFLLRLEKKAAKEFALRTVRGTRGVLLVEEL